MANIYKNTEAEEWLMQLYDEKLKSLGIKYTEEDIRTSFGRTRVVKAGNPKKEPVVLFHGYNAGAPITLEAIKDLTNDYHFIVIETLGQTTKSEVVKMNIKDQSFALWAEEVLNALSISKCTIIGISYGAFIVGKLITHKPEKINKCILVVPSGIANGNFWDSTKKLTLPMLQWKVTQKEKHLRKFLNAFIPKGDEFMYKMLSVIMKGTVLDTRIPKLLKPNDVNHFTKPTYVMVADNDVYFPGEEVLKRSRVLFKGLKDTHILKNSNHMPSKNSMKEMQSVLRKWLN